MEIKTSIKNFRLAFKPTIVGTFLLLVLPVLTAITFFTYHSNEEMTRKVAYESVNRTQEILKLKLHEFVNPGEIAAKTISAIGNTNPDYLLAKKSTPYLLSVLKSSENILSVDIGFEDGNFRSVKRVRPGDEIQGKKVPAEALYAVREIDKTSSTPTIYSYYYFDKNDQELGNSSSAKPYIPKGRGWYKEAEKKGELSFTDPYVKASSGTGISIVSPFYKNKAIFGVVAIDIKLTTVSELLKDLSSSEQAISLLLDESGGVIASSNKLYSPKVVDEDIIATPLHGLPTKLPSLALLSKPKNSNQPFIFDEPSTQSKYMATINEMPVEFTKRWKIMIVSPLSDFAGMLIENNKFIVKLGLVGLVVQIFLIAFAAGYISRPLTVLTREIQDLMEFRSSPTVNYSQNISEIGLLSNAITRLRSTILAFTSYIPRDLVNDLLKSGSDLQIGGESRYLTMFFTDLKDFSTISEVTPVRELLRKVSSYLELVTFAVKEEHGTVDKFIGDAVMAFWGAPRHNEHHAYHASVAAVKSQRRMAVLNKRIQSENPKALPLSVRIGLHCDAVLVGNIGSKERLSYTVMGDGVNVASRLEGINKEYGTKICISHSMFKEAGERLWIRPIDKITVKGRKGEILIYELIGVRDGDEETQATKDEQVLCEMTWNAYALFDSGQHSDAKAAYLEIVTLYNDPLAKVMVEKCHAVETTSA